MSMTRYYNDGTPLPRAVVLYRSVPGRHRAPPTLPQRISCSHLPAFQVSAGFPYPGEIIRVIYFVALLCKL
ncbi:hypothetical protein AHAS_Ahas05G0132000 [Arachis hypogaea]|uniref:Uncharacterized protein n=1 Tax=Arachis hypogaea TaxID=3818 RepID=A0A445D6J2_ARAHY|nr:hypothetical protein Ahy_A05g024629 isoform A [Arachis hypogaea]